jgi:mRNA-degrading endonuclease RelE of RelBE toxin-antitoxin system
LDLVDSNHHSRIRKTIHEQLSHSPTEETRNRKPLDEPAPFGATWELRCGRDNRFRVFYEADSATREVHVLAIGVKDHNRLLIGGEEYQS